MACQEGFRLLENQRKERKQMQAKLVSVAMAKARKFQVPMRLEIERGLLLCIVHGLERLVEVGDSMGSMVLPQTTPFQYRWSFQLKLE